MNSRIIEFTKSDGNIVLLTWNDIWKIYHMAEEENDEDDLLFYLEGVSDTVSVPEEKYDEILKDFRYEYDRRYECVNERDWELRCDIFGELTKPYELNK